MQIIDISPVISEATAVFPGDTHFSRKVAMEFAHGDHLTLSDITSTVHIGAHVDAPNHYVRGGESIDQRALDLYYGPCQVIRVSPKSPDGRIRLEDLLGTQGLVDGKRVRRTSKFPPRVLFATGTFSDPNKWRNDFASLSPELVEWLASQNVQLVGIDTPSIDPAASKKLESHNAVAKHDMAILEGVVLDHVKPGVYTLIALPLRLQGADASPVRAVLIK